MTGKEHHIDKAVRGASSGFEAAPPPGVWSRLDRSLDARQRGAVLSIRRKILTTAAVILAFVSGYFLAMVSRIDSPDMAPIQTPLLAVEYADTAEAATPLLPAPRVTTHSAPSEPLIASHESTSIPLSPRHHDPIDPIHPTRPTQPSDQPIHTTTPQSELPQIAFNEWLPDFDGLIIPVLEPFTSPVTPPLNTDFQAVDRLPGSRWRIAGIAGQTVANYYQTSAAAPLADGVYQHDMMGTMGEQMLSPLFSWGLNLQYQLSTRTGISTGLAFHQFSTPMVNPVTANYTMLSSGKLGTNPLGAVVLDQTVEMSLAKSPGQEVNPGDFTQHISYLEIPITATWGVSFNRVSLSLSGGIGGNLLQGNDVMHTTESDRQSIGTTDGIKELYFSGILAADVSIRLDEQWHWSFLPVYRHALHSVSQSEFRPRIISFGLYTGLQFRF